MTKKDFISRKQMKRKETEITQRKKNNGKSKNMRNTFPSIEFSK